LYANDIFAFPSSIDPVKLELDLTPDPIGLIAAEIKARNHMHRASLFVAHADGILEVRPEFTKIRVKGHEKQFILKGETLSGILFGSGGQSVEMGEANIYNRSFPDFLANEIQAYIQHQSVLYAGKAGSRLSSDI
jgi:hypothetical protein